MTNYTRRTLGKTILDASSNLAISTKTKASAGVLFVLAWRKRFEKGNRKAIATVRGTVEVPGCVSASAEASRANLAISTNYKRPT